MIKKNKDTVANMIGHFERDFHKGKGVIDLILYSLLKSDGKV
jgi:hypothetical protein